MTEPSTEPTAEAPAEEPTTPQEPVSATSDDGATATQAEPAATGYDEDERPYGLYQPRPYAVAALAFTPHPFDPMGIVCWEHPHEGQPERYVLEAAGVSLELPGDAKRVDLTDLTPGSEVKVVITAYHADGNSGMLYLPPFPIAGVQDVTDEEG